MLLSSFTDPSSTAVAAEVTPAASAKLERSLRRTAHISGYTPSSNSATTIARTTEGSSRSQPLQTTPAGSEQIVKSASAVSSSAAPTLAQPLTSVKAPFPGNASTVAAALKAESASRPAEMDASLQKGLLAQSSPGSTTSPGDGAGGTSPGTASPDTTTPGTISPGTTPDTTTPGTTPDTTTPGATPDTTTPGTISPGTTPDTTTPGTTTPGTTPSDTTPAPPTQPNQPGTNLLQDVSPGRATRSGSSYFGVGGNIGIGSGDTALGEGSFAIISKIGLTRQFSVRPSLLIEDNVTILLPLTYDFSFGTTPTDTFGFRAAPYVGIGPAISTGDGGSVDLLLTGGFDIPLSSQFTLNAAVNATVTGEAAIGILLGIGYNFQGF